MCVDRPHTFSTEGKEERHSIKQQRDITEWKDASVPLYGIASSWLQVVRVKRSC